MIPIATAECAPAPQNDLSTLPRRVDRKTGANLVTLHFFPVTPRTLEVWPLDWLLVRGRAVCETRELFAAAQAKLDAAPALPSVRRRMPAGDRRIASREADTDRQPAE
jgi:hypothetical protein